MDRNAPALRARVVQVLDGDTVRLDNRRMKVRLSGLDGPEIWRPGRKPCEAGRFAHAVLRSLCLGAEVLFRPEPNQPRLDPHGRHVGYLEVQPGRRDVGGAIILSGWAWVAPWHPCALAAQYRLAQRQAIAWKVGLWSPNPPCDIGDDARRILNPGQNVLVPSEEKA